jgi:hypothetical protein
MLRRVSTQVEETDDEFRYIQVPPSRKKDKEKVSNSTKDRAFKPISFEDLMDDTNNSGDSLGKFPGDKVIPIPFPIDSEDTIIKAAEKARRNLIKEYKPKKPKKKVTVKGSKKIRVVSKAEVLKKRKKRKKVITK